MAAVAERERVTERRRDHRRRIAVDVALALADSNAGWGDFPRALEHLAAAEQIAGGSLASRYADRRESWIQRSPASPT
jgi:hypothetical protein